VLKNGERGKVPLQRIVNVTWGNRPQPSTAKQSVIRGGVIRSVRGSSSRGGEMERKEGTPGAELASLNPLDD